MTEPQNWDVFIGHFLGVDHAGHKFGPNHAEMRRKLTEMDHVIRKTVEMMPSDCVLFVMGNFCVTTVGDLNFLHFPCILRTTINFF